MKKIYSLLVFTFCIIHFNYAQPGTLDNSFGVNGKVLFEPFQSSCKSVATQKDGKIVTGGTTDVSSSANRKFVITRFNSDGSVDQHFGDNGIMAFNDIDGSTVATLNKIIIQEDNKILICGSVVTSGKHDIGVIRLNEDGSFDNSFGGNGKIVKSIGLYDDIGSDEINDMQIQQDGNILITGLKGDVVWEPLKPYILRLLASGSTDESFGEAGIIIPENITGIRSMASIDLSVPGKITVAGTMITNSTILLLRYNMDGSIDNSFGISGVTLQQMPKMTNGNSIFTQVTDMKILPDRSIWVFGYSYVKKYGTIILVKFDEYGKLDATVGGGSGYIIPDFTSDYTRAVNVYITNKNKVMITGSYTNEAIKDGFAVFCFRYDGSLDSSFGENGVAVSPFGIGDASLDDISGAVQPDGKIVVGASVYPDDDASGYIGLVRFNGNGGVTQENYVRLKRWMRKHGFTWSGSFISKQNPAYTVQRSSDGKNFVSLSKIYAPDDKGNFNYEDVQPLKGKNYYRVACEASGKTIYSNIILIDDDIAVKVFPNPAKTNIQVIGLPQGKVRLTIVDVSGNVKMTRTFEGESVSIAVENLPKGHYIIRILTADNKSVMEKFYKE